MRDDLYSAICREALESRQYRDSSVKRNDRSQTRAGSPAGYGAGGAEGERGETRKQRIPPIAAGGRKPSMRIGERRAIRIGMRREFTCGVDTARKTGRPLKRYVGDDDRQ